VPNTPPRSSRRDIILLINNQRVSRYPLLVDVWYLSFWVIDTFNRSSDVGEYQLTEASCMCIYTYKYIHINICIR
jgi:hypothetical protein